MAEEKRIRISAEDSGFSDRVKQMAEDAQQEFSKLGLDEVLSSANDQITDLGERLKSIRQEVENKRTEGVGKISERLEERKQKIQEDKTKRVEEIQSGGGNEAYKNRRISEVESQSDEETKKIEKETSKEIKDYNKNLDNAVKKLDKLFDRMMKEDKEGRAESVSEEDDGESVGRSRVGRRGGIANTLRQFFSGNFGGLTSMAGNAAGDVAAGGAASAGASGATSAMTGNIVAAVVIAIGAALGALVKSGYEQIRTDAKVRAKFDIENGEFGRGGEEFGMKMKDFKEFILESANSRGDATDIENIARRQLVMSKAYGLGNEELFQFDRFRRQDNGGGNGTSTMLDFISKAQKMGLKGASDGDFTLLSEKLGQVRELLEIQKKNSERVDSVFSTNLLLAGQKIGGRFEDDRAVDSFSRIDNSIKNQQNPGVRAFMFQAIKQANPNMSYPELMAQMEGGLNEGNTGAIFGQINKMPQGMMRQMLLKQMTGSWQDALRLDSGNNIKNLMSATGGGVTNADDLSKTFDMANFRKEQNVTGLDQSWNGIKNFFSGWGESLSRKLDGVIKVEVQNPEKGEPGYFIDRTIGETNRTITGKNSKTGNDQYNNR